MRARLRNVTSVTTLACVQVGTRELKAKLTEYLRLVQRGAQLVVTHHGRPIAELRPLGWAVVPDREAQLGELAASGLVTLPIGRLSRFKPLLMKGPSLSEAVLEDRR